MSPRRLTRAQQAAATHDEVLRAARDEFERVGFEAASVRAIAARAGVSAGTVLHYAGDKRELLHAALFGDLERTLGGAFDGLPATGLSAQLHEVTERVFGYYRRRPKLSRVLLQQSLFAEGPWSQRFVAQVGTVHGRVTELALQAVARGELRSDADGVLVGAAWFSFFYFSLIGWVQGAVVDPVKLVSRLFAQHLAGLQPASPPRPRRQSR